MFYTWSTSFVRETGEGQRFLVAISMLVVLFVIAFDSSAEDLEGLRAAGPKRKLATIVVSNRPVACKAREFYLATSMNWALGVAHE